MLKLQNQHLTIDILHPNDDQSFFGVRYCTGGYIHQIHDAHHGALMTGPTYPASFNWFDGQGIPDAFNLSPLHQTKGSDSEVEIIGIGRCDLIKKQVLKFCEWTIEHKALSTKMTTQQAFGDFNFQLERTISLVNRTVRSHTTIKNHGMASIPLCWFPHPFYPQPKNHELCQFNIPVAISDNEAYFLTENGFISRKGKPIIGGSYQALDHQAQSPLRVIQRHPTLGSISARCSYIPSLFPIWGNENTFSWEPFLEHSIAKDKAFSWSIDYNF